MTVPLFVIALLWDRFDLGQRRLFQARPVHPRIGRLPWATNSVNVAVAGVFAVLLYFNEGVGCDACSYQTAKLEADSAFGALDLTAVMNPAAQVQTELRRFDLRTPYLIDPDGSVSRSYDTLGTGHHADLPGHSFVLVGPDGRMRWRGDYPGMWVEPSELAESVRAELG